MGETSSWAGFAEEAKARRPKGPACGVALALALVPAEDRTQVEAVIGDRDVQATAVARALRARLGDTAPAAFVIQRHRRRECSCNRGDTG